MANEPLTATQLQILQWLALDVPVKEMAERLGISQKTVEWHVNGTENPRSLFVRLGVRTKGAAVRYAVENQLVKPGEQETMSEKGEKDEKAVKPMKTTEDLAQALLDAAGQAAAGKANVLQVSCLCNCAQSLIELTRVHLEMLEAEEGLKKRGGKLAALPWAR